MVTAFLRFGVLARLQIGYKRQAAPPNRRKKTRLGGFFVRCVQITWVPKHLPQEPKPPLQVRKHQPQGRRLQQRVP
jgi:hypothetical protein